MPPLSITGCPCDATPSARTVVPTGVESTGSIGSFTLTGTTSVILTGVESTGMVGVFTGLTLPAVCTELTETTCYADVFDRADSGSLGPDWTEYTGGGLIFDIHNTHLRAILGTTGISAAAWAAFPTGATHQTSRLIYKGSYLDGAHDSQITNFVTKFGGPAVRMSGVAGDYDTTCSCYTVTLQEDRDFNSPFDRITSNLSVEFHAPFGTTNFNGRAWKGDHYQSGQSAFQFADIGKTGPDVDDEIKLTAMNYMVTPGVTEICIHVYLNGFLVFDIAQIHPTYKLLTGQTGFSIGASNGTERGFAVDWDDWQGCEAVPV